MTNPKIKFIVTPPPDATVENSDASYTDTVASGATLVVPDINIEVNTVVEGSVPAIKDVKILITDGVNPVTPDDVSVVGDTVTVEVPSGGAVMNVDFSADKVTAAPGETITFTDLTDNSPTHWSWRFDSEGESIVQNPTFSFSTTGFKNITLLAGKVGAGGVEIKNSFIEVTGDADAQAFLNAAGITDATISGAIAKLVQDMKNFNLWTKLIAFYPFVGGTASTKKFNLKDPQDTNAAFRLDFFGGWTHSANGSLPNGSNGYADTHVNALNDTLLNDFSAGIYHNTVGGAASSQVSFGWFNNPTNSNGTHVFPRFSGDLFKSRCNDASSAGRDVAGQTRTDGIFQVNRTGSAGYTAAYNKSKTTFTQASTALENLNYFLSARNNQGTAGNFGNLQVATFYLSSGMTNTELDNMADVIQDFNTTLSREVTL
jgi:PKD repeat protein